MQKLDPLSKNHFVPATSGIYVPADFQKIFHDRTPDWINDHGGCGGDDEETSERTCDVFEFTYDEKNVPQFSSVHDWLKELSKNEDGIYWTKNQIKDFFTVNPDLFLTDVEQQNWFFMKGGKKGVCAGLVNHHDDGWRLGPYPVNPRYAHGVKNGARIFIFSDTLR